MFLASPIILRAVFFPLDEYVCVCVGFEVEIITQSNYVALNGTSQKLNLRRTFLLSTTAIGSCSIATMRSVIVLSLLLLNINHVISAPKGVTASLKAKWSMTPFLLETRYSTFLGNAYVQ